MFKILAMFFISICTVFLAPITQAANDECPLKTKTAYSLPGVNNVYYITPECTRQVFSGPTAYFRYFPSWAGIRSTNSKILNKIPQDKQYVIPASPNSTVENASSTPVSAPVPVCPIKTGSAVKVPNGKTVYYITAECTKQKFSNPAAFFKYFTSWKQVKTVKTVLFNKIPKDANYVLTNITETTTNNASSSTETTVKPPPTCPKNTILVNGICILKAGCDYKNPSCSSTEKCVNNQCVQQLTWQDKINALLLPGYLKTLDADGNLVLTSENYKVILPDQKAEGYGKWLLNYTRVCAKEIKNILGQDPFIPGVLVNKTIIDEKLQVSACCFAPDNSINNYLGKTSFENKVFSDDAQWKNTSNNYTYCSGGHEELHRFLDGTMVPKYLEEGLATYVELAFKQASPGYYAFPQKNVLTCNDNSFSTSPFGGGDITDIPFRNLVSNFSDEPRIYSYYTAYCFWNRIQNKYGDAAFKQVLANAYKLSNDKNAKFVRDAVVPVTGEEIWDYLKNMGITPANDE